MSQQPTRHLNSILLSVKEFLTITVCPDEWLHFNLYLFCDASTTFYVGQSELAFARVWRHIQDGFKGRSLVGKFIRVNWPKSMHFTVQLISAESAKYSHVDYGVNDAERMLIEELAPCFNESLNSSPSPVPNVYRNPDENVPYPRHLGRMMREADAAMERRRRDHQNAEWN